MANIISQIFTYTDQGTNHIYGWLVEPLLRMTHLADKITLDVEDWYKSQGCHNRVDMRYVPEADINKPVMVLPIENGASHVVVDGTHRLMRCHLDGVSEIYAYLFSLDIANSCRLPDVVAKMVDSEVLGELIITP